MSQANNMFAERKKGYRVHVKISNENFPLQQKSTNVKQTILIMWGL